MSNMLKECNKHHHAMAIDLQQAGKALENAKQSTDPEEIRAGIDEAQKQLGDIKQHTDRCGSMMKMMK